MTPPTAPLKPSDHFIFLLDAIAHDNPCDLPAHNITHLTKDQLEKVLAVAPKTPDGKPILHHPNFERVTFTGRASFDGTTFTGRASFNETTFEGGASFDGTTFTGETSFNETTFEGRTSFGRTRFNRTTFEDRARFDGTTFTDQTHFNETTFRGGASFNKTRFRGETRFDGTTFTRWTHFDETTFTGETRFNKTTFEGGASFDGTTFTGETIFYRTRFNRTTFEDRARFDGTTFTDQTSFYKTTFRGGASFNRTRFRGETRFNETTFEDKANFDETTFEDKANFDETTFEDKANFDETTFTGKTSFNKTMFVWGVKFGGVTFKQSVESFSVFSWGRADFSGTQFMRGGALRFSGSEIVLDGARFGAQKVLIEGDNTVWKVVEAFAALLVLLVSSHIPVLSRKKEKQGVPRLLSLRGVDASILTLAGLDLSQCSFDKVHNLDRLRFEQNLVFRRPPKRFFQPKRRVLLQEALWRKKHPRSGKKWDPLPLPQNLHVPFLEPKDLAQIYRDLRKGREDAKNEPGAADFYYGEMEMRRRSDPWGTCRLLDAYWLVSGYGLRPLRSGAWLGAVVLMAIAVFSSWGLEDMEGSSSLLKFHDAVQFSLGALVSMSTVENTDLTRVGKWVRIALRFLGPLLLGLTVLAVRGRVKR